jgi:hypothetical protein
MSLYGCRHFPITQILMESHLGSTLSRRAVKIEAGHFVRSCHLFLTFENDDLSEALAFATVFFI